VSTHTARIPAPLDARAMLDLLRRHYIPDPARPGGIFAPEIAAPGPLRRHADLIWQGATASSGHELIGHEIKVTRADLLAELADPAKSDPWQACCDRWYLVIPDAALIEGIDLPPTWGVLTPPSGRRTRSMTSHRPAPRLAPTDQANGLRVLATWLHWRHHNLAGETRYARAESNRLRERCEALTRAAGPLDTPARQREHQVVQDILRKLGGVDPDGQAVGQSWSGQEVRVDDVVAALLDLGTVYDRARRVQWSAQSVVSSLQQAIRGIDSDALAKLDAAVTALQREQPSKH